MRRSYLVLLAWRSGLVVAAVVCIVAAFFLPAAVATGAILFGALLALVASGLTVYSSIRSRQLMRAAKDALPHDDLPASATAPRTVASRGGDGWVHYADPRVMRLLAMEFGFCLVAVVFFVIAAFIGDDWRNTFVVIGLLELAIAGAVLVTFVAAGIRRRRAAGGVAHHDWSIVSDPQMFSERISPTAPVESYPNPPKVVRVDHGLGYPSLGCRYIVPCEGDRLVAVIHAAALRVPRLTVVEITERSAHFGNLAILGIGYEVLVAHFTSVGGGRTRTDWIDRAPQGVVNSAPSHLQALLTEIVHGLDALEPPARTQEIAPA